jgi:hypothetical protein
MTALVAVTPDPPLTPAGAELLRLNEQLAEATRDLEIASTPLRRVEAIKVEAEQVERDLAASRAEDSEKLGQWIAQAAAGERPQPSVRTLSLERRLATLSADLPGAASVHQAHLTAVQRASERVALFTASALARSTGPRQRPRRLTPRRSGSRR